MEGIFVIFLFVGVIAITALLFGVWLIVSIIRLIGKGIAALFVAPPPPKWRAISQHPASGIRCAAERCLATNPPAARFCRRCGAALPIQRVTASRRAACL